MYTEEYIYISRDVSHTGDRAAIPWPCSVDESKGSGNADGATANRCLESPNSRTPAQGIDA